MESELVPDRLMDTCAMTLQPKIAEDGMETSVDYFNSLPDELLMLIFSYLPHSVLPKCSMVSRRWCRISSDESLWIRTTLRYAKIPITALAMLIKRGIRHLDMRSAEIREALPWRRCFSKKYRCKLVELDLSLAQISERGLVNLLRPCRKLVRFQSMGVRFNYRVCEALGFNPELQLLNLFDSQGLDARGLTAILKGCPTLEDLNLNNSNLPLSALDVLTENLSSSLTSLSLYSCGVHLQDRHVFEIVERCPNLRYLNISFNGNLTEAAFERARTLKHLEEFVEDGEFLWNFADDDFDDDNYIDDSDDFYDDGYDFDDIFHSDSEEDGVVGGFYDFPPVLDENLDDLAQPVDMDDFDADDSSVGQVGDVDTTDEELDCSDQEHSAYSSESDGLGVGDFSEESVNLNEVDAESSSDLHSDGTTEDDTESLDGDDDEDYNLGSDQGDDNDDFDVEDDDDYYEQGDL